MMNSKGNYDRTFKITTKSRANTTNSSRFFGELKKDAKYLCLMNKKQNLVIMESTMIGNKIALARKKMNISQAQLAESMFVSPQAVGKWERGESMPDIIT